ncbi:MAG: YraN family protein [Candidatus Binatia bacterium]|nr:YraN family protein [Candidatus Binatia bacterium]
MARAKDPRIARGRAAEDAACELLVRSGYTIVARNVRLAGAEVDVVALDGSTTVFIEVRSRSSRRHGGPLATIGREKQARIARVAAAYLSRQRRAVAARFDVVGVEWGEGHPVCTLIRSAFDSPF